LPHPLSRFTPFLAYGVGENGPDELLIVRSDLSHWVVVDPVTALLGVNVADHEIMVLAVRYVVLFVSNLPPVATVVSVNVTGVPVAGGVQVPFSYRVNTTVPATGNEPFVVTVASSCGSHFCWVVMAEVCCTVKHSVVMFVCVSGS
jgi:hypothetical protein